MSSTRTSALNGAALFAGGAVVGTALYTLARSLVTASGRGGDRSSEAGTTPALHHSVDDRQKALEATTLRAPAESVDKEGLFVAPTSNLDATYDNVGVMGVPNGPRASQPLVQPQDTHIQLGLNAAGQRNVHELPDLSKSMLTLSLLVIEMLALEHSGTIFTYESSATGFGAFCESRSNDTNVAVHPMQTRAGAGQAVAGFLAGEGSAATPAGGRSTVTVLTNAAGFLAMGPSLATIDAANADLVVHVSGVNQAIHEDLAVTNDYASTLATASMLGHAGFEVLLSASRQEAIDMAHYAYMRRDKRALVHIFDGAYSACEMGLLSPPSSQVPTPFAYTGPAAPETVLCMPNGAMSLRARTLLLSLPSALRSKLGIVSVRVLCPWDDVALREAVPTSVQTIRVVEEAFSSTDGAIYSNTLESVLSGAFAEQVPNVQSLVRAPGQHIGLAAWYEILQAAASQPSTPLTFTTILERANQSATNVKDLTPLSGSHLITFFGSDHGVTLEAASLLTRALYENGKHVRMLSRFDNFAAGGAVRTDIVVSDRQGLDIPMDLLARDGASHVVIVSEPSTLLSGYKLFDALRDNGTVLLNASNWTPDDVSASLCDADKALLAKRHANVFVVDALNSAQCLLDSTATASSNGSGKTKDGRPLAAADLAASAVLTSVIVAEPTLASNLKKAVFLRDQSMHSVLADRTASVPTDTWNAASISTDDESDEATGVRQAHLSYNGLYAITKHSGNESQVTRASWALAAWQLMFREAYDLDDKALRPDLPEKTYNITVAVNKRLTPLDYDRYLFHMELDTTGTDLRYEVGEALGVHGWNDEKEVEDFVRWCGLSPDELVYAPSVTRPGSWESRTVFQTLQQNLDIFGKPPKSFYEALGKIVRSKDEARWLRFISSNEGNSTFKKLSESETVTYVDVLHMFPTADLNIDWLVKNIEPIKPRHYSIASAQVAVGNSVHLLIVTVDWKTPHGSPRFGQCTRYLAGLKPGTKVTVSLKPSVMKLPPLDSQPIIMAGLGTGAAPFRAFLQARAYKKSLGHEVGPMYYYFGSRHRAMEYLYGEELEAYVQDGLLTHLGLAFSRDQKQKVYIQHKIIEDGKQLAKHLVPDIDSTDNKVVRDEDKGIFTLCGPVWPVPDIQEALVTAFTEYGWSREQAEEKIADLKEEERYVLEVY